MKIFRLANRNLFRNRRRTLFTLISISVSLFIFAALTSLPIVVNQILRDRAGSLRLVVMPKAGYFYALPEAYMKRIRAVLHVEAVVGVNPFLGYYRGPDDQVPSIAIDPEQITQVMPDFGISPAAARQYKSVRGAALVGSILLTRYGWHVGDNVTVRGTIYPVNAELRIVGTLGDKAPPYAMLFRRDYLEELLGRPATVNFFWVKVDSSAAIPSIIAAIDEDFANSSAETHTDSEVSLGESKLSEFRLLFDGAQVLAALVLVTIGLVATNTGAMSVRERRHEFAVMRTLGFTRGEILGALLAEGLGMAAIGGILGCTAAWGALKLMPYVAGALGPLVMILSLSPRVVALSMTAAFAIGVVSNLVPGIAALRRDIADGLRAVG
ncbi:MAG: ABC transporter permease [Candidatus Binataceae bacterium]